jgi:hypothetical protein
VLCVCVCCVCVCCVCVCVCACACVCVCLVCVCVRVCEQPRIRVADRVAMHPLHSKHAIVGTNVN